MVWFLLENLRNFVSIYFVSNTLVKHFWWAIKLIFCKMLNETGQLQVRDPKIKLLIFNGYAEIISVGYWIYSSRILNHFLLKFKLVKRLASHVSKENDRKTSIRAKFTLVENSLYRHSLRFIKLMSVVFKIGILFLKKISIRAKYRKPHLITI